MTGVLAFKVKSAMIRAANPQEHKNVHQVWQVLHSVLNQQRVGGCVEVKELGDQGHGSESQ